MSSWCEFGKSSVLPVSPRGFESAFSGSRRCARISVGTAFATALICAGLCACAGSNAPTPSPISAPTSSVMPSDPHSDTASVTPTAPLGARQWKSGGILWTDTSNGPLLHGLVGVPSGYLGICDQTSDAVGTACTSPHAIAWRSIDGVARTERDSSPLLRGFAAGALWFAHGNFLVMGTDGHVLSSPNGESWVALHPGIVPVMADAAGEALFGDDYDGTRVGAPKYFSNDSADSWQPIQRPQPATDLLSLAALPAGGYLATTWDSQIRQKVMITSKGGVTWSQLGATLAMDTVVTYADRLYASGSLDSPGTDLLVWNSSDAGRSWQQVTDADGSPMTGRVLVVGAKLLISIGGAQFGIVCVGSAN